MSSPLAPPPAAIKTPPISDEAEPLFPQTRNEYITVLAHYHRAEIARMAGWRDRIDRTTNWALTVAAAMMSVSLSTPNAHHGVLLFAMLLVTLLLRIEARRYRFFDVYRARVRLLERNYYANVLDPARRAKRAGRGRSGVTCASLISTSPSPRRARAACGAITSGSI